LLPPVQKCFTGANGDNEGLEQPSYRITITQILKSKAKREAPFSSFVNFCEENIFTEGNEGLE